MPDSTQFAEYAMWQLSHPYTFHWKNDGSILSARFRLPGGKIPADRLANAFRRRGVQVTRCWDVLSVSACTVDVFLDALAVVKISWERFKPWVDFVHFDGTKHITDLAPLITQDTGPQPPAYWCRWHNDIKGHLPADLEVKAETAHAAALEYWKSNRRNHPLPQLVDVIDAAETYQVTVRLQEEITVQPVRASVLACA